MSLNNVLKSDEKNRDVTFDVVRSISIISIVLGWHLLDYLDDISYKTSLIWGSLTYMSLATFSLMSGYFLKRNKIECYADVFRFYKKRFARFWCLFFVASLSLYIASFVAGNPWYPSFINFIMSLFGLSAFFKPLPATLWFMVIMTFFYLITPPSWLLSQEKYKYLCLLL